MIKKLKWDEGTETNMIKQYKKVWYGKIDHIIMAQIYEFSTKAFHQFRSLSVFLPNEYPAIAKDVDTLEEAKDYAQKEFEYYVKQLIKE